MIWRIDGKYSQFLSGVLLVTLALAWSAWHWLHIDVLLSGDNLRWMAEALRASRGEVIYRDFTSMYPSLGVLFMALLYRSFGATFAVTNAMLDGLSILLLLVVWRVARRLLDERVALGCTIVLMCMGATNTGNFALFSLSLYTPAILWGGIGIGLFLMGALDILADDSSYWSKALIVFGLTLAIQSKLEHGVAGIAAFGVLAFSTLPRPFRGERAHSWALSYSGLGAAVVISSLLVYALLARSAGWNNLLDGLSGYGVAAQYCPLWPTGLGLLGGLSSLGQALAAVAMIAIVYTRTLRRFLVCVAAALFGTALWIIHLPYALENFRVAQPGLKGLSLVAGYLLSFSGLLLPFMWAAIASAIFLGIRLVRRLLRGTSTPLKDASVLLLLVVTASLASRGTFGHMFGNATVAHQSCYAFLLLLTPYFLLHAQALVDVLAGDGNSWRNLMDVSLPDLRTKPSRRAWLLLIATAAIFMVPRVVKSLSRSAAPLVQTNAGRAYIPDRASRDAYAFVVANTSPDDGILEVPLGGGLTFAAGRQFSAHSMQFKGLLTPKRIMRADADLVRTHPPRLVLGLDSTNLGSVYGVCCRCACTFPNLVWRSKRLACDPEQHFEALDFVMSHYTVVAHFGNFVALSPLTKGTQFLPRDSSVCASCSAQ